MSLPFFYINELDKNAVSFVLNEETSRHVIQVLRMKMGQHLQLTDGKGNIVKSVITDDHKKKCVVSKLDFNHISRSSKKIIIGISLVKNNNRFEWFLEKATEIGVSAIIPLICERTEKQHFRFDRMNTILVSAMLQSQQAWLPQLHEPLELKKFWKANSDYEKFEKYIAWCEDSKSKLQLSSVNVTGSSIILIGPEGDFSTAEIAEAMDHGYKPVALGETRLRTETAGIVSAVLLHG